VRSNINDALQNVAGLYFLQCVAGQLVKIVFSYSINNSRYLNTNKL